MTSEGALFEGTINPFERINIAGVKLLLGKEGFDDKSTSSILSACKSLGIDVFSSRAIDQLAGIAAVLLLCEYDVDFSSLFGKARAQSYSQAISVAFKKIRDTSKVSFTPKKGPDVRRENARDLAAKLHEQRKDLTFMKDISNDTYDKIKNPENQPKAVKEAVVKPEPDVGDSPEDREPLAGGIGVTIPAEIVIGPQAIVALQKAVVDKFASIMEGMKNELFEEVSAFVNDRIKAVAPPEKPATPKPEKPVAVQAAPERIVAKTRRFHVVIIDLNHLFVYAKNTKIYYGNVWLECTMKRIYENVAITVKKLGIPFDIDNIVGHVFVSKSFENLRKHIDEFCVGNKDVALRAFPGKFDPWHVVPGTKFYKGREIDMDVDTWVVNEVNKEIYKAHPGEILTIHVVCGDKDMLPAVDAAKEAGVHVVVMSYKRAVAMEMAARASDVQYLD